MIDVENHAVCENYSCEVRGFVFASIRITWYVEITPFEVRGFRERNPVANGGNYSGYLSRKFEIL